MGRYTLEVQRLCSRISFKCPMQAKHVGYMDVVFNTKKEALDYYNKHNPHMKPMKRGVWRSDYDPVSFLSYVVRSVSHEVSYVPPFEDALFIED